MYLKLFTSNHGLHAIRNNVCKFNYEFNLTRFFASYFHALINFQPLIPIGVTDLLEPGGLMLDTNAYRSSDTSGKNVPGRFLIWFGPGLLRNWGSSTMACMCWTWLYHRNCDVPIRTRYIFTRFRWIIPITAQMYLISVACTLDLTP